MAVTLESLKTMEVTFVVEKPVVRRQDELIYGEPARQLPWAFIRFNDAGEEKKYITTLAPSQMSFGNGIYTTQLEDYVFSDPNTSVQMTFGKSFIEFMPNRPFPLENSQPASTNGRPGGNVAIHYFGGI